MVKLLIIADDFTGALDTGVIFSENGIDTEVSIDWKQEITGGRPNVLVLDAETRHLPPEEADARIREIAERARKSGIRRFVKKTDSALRGNIGAELEALMRGSHQNIIHFLPAYPEMKRITEKGIHYINGVPVAESVFGKDPCEPVVSSDIKEIIGSQSGVRTSLLPNEDPIWEKTIKGTFDLRAAREIRKAEEDINHNYRSGADPEILIYDVTTDEEMHSFVKAILEDNPEVCMAGCAGLCRALVREKKLLFDSQEAVRRTGEKEMLVLCGSVNPITVRQLDYAEKNGFYRIKVPAWQMLTENYFESDEGKLQVEKWKEICLKHPKCILDTNDSPGQVSSREYARQNHISNEEIRKRITSALASIGKQLMEQEISNRIFVTGGDTLVALMNALNAKTLVPFGEALPGTVLSEITYRGKKYQLFTKSGGFGEENLLVSL